MKKVLRLIEGAFFLLFGLAVVYGGLGIAGVLAENGLDFMNHFVDVEPEPTIGFVLVAIGVMGAVYGLYAIVTQPTKEAWEDYPADDEMRGGKSLK